MPVPYHVAATALKTIIDTEFASRGISALHDKLHESLGHRRAEVGISPTREAPQPNNEVVGHIFILVQWYDLWDQEINPEQQVNPFPITEMADRFRRAVERHDATTPGSSEVWYFRVTEVTYPDDPTGNKTRFEATVQAFGNNTGLIETIS